MKRNTIKLKNGILTSEDGITIYKEYLSTMKEDYNKVVRRPVRESIFKAMCGVHSKKNEQADVLFNQVKSDGGKIYFWSDQHINHNNIIKFSDRPFHSTEEMNEYMYSEYFNIVTEKDLVIFGGDVAFGDVNETKERLQQLPGKKILVLGNHEFDKNKCIYREYHVFDATVMAFVFQESIDNKICNIIVTHYPLDISYLPENSINIHGHIHCHLAGEKRINMAVEHTEYKPKDMTERIIEEFKTYC